MNDATQTSHGGLVNLPSKIATAIDLLTPRHPRHRPVTAMAKLTNGNMKGPHCMQGPQPQARRGRAASEALAALK
jgi:hypothetical protein